MGVKVDAETFNTAIPAMVIGFFVVGSIVWPLCYWMGKRSGRANTILLGANPQVKNLLGGAPCCAAIPMPTLTNTN